jgi:hypothetical protein
MNVTVSKITRLDGQLCGVGIGARYYVEAPAGGPSWGLRVTFTLLYPNG